MGQRPSRGDDAERARPRDRPGCRRGDWHGLTRRDGSENGRGRRRRYGRCGRSRGEHIAGADPAAASAQRQHREERRPASKFHADCVRVGPAARQNRSVWSADPPPPSVTDEDDGNTAGGPLSGDSRIPSDYFHVAQEILERDGHRALNIAELCRRLHVSKGSFYHHFDSWQEFVGALLRDWENAFGRWWAAADRDLDPVARINMTLDFVADEMLHRLDAAIREWGRSDPEVGAAVARLDETVAYANEQTLSLIVHDPARRQLLTELGLNVWAGMQVRGRLDRDYMLRLSMETVRSNWGVECVLVEEGGRAVARVVPESVWALVEAKPLPGSYHRID
ncbi:MAG: TetR/AcrR family transcriptional regulator [Sporichthyaceae bacterium]